MPDSGASKPRIGLIAPNGKVSPEATELYGDQVDFFAVRNSVGTFRATSYDRATEQIPAAATHLLHLGVDAISVMGTSLTFYRGRSHNRSIRDELAAMTGVPVSTMSSAMIRALRVTGARRIAIVAAYSAEVTQRLVGFVHEYGFETAGIEHLGIIDGRLLSGVSTDTIEAAARAAVGQDDVDAVAISCGGLRTLEATRRLEPELGIPVITSAIAGAWDAVRLVGLTGHRHGAGRLLEISDSTPAVSDVSQQSAPSSTPR